MKRRFILVIFLLFVCLTKSNIVAQENENCSKFSFRKWEKISKNKTIYSYKETKLELRHFLNEKENVGGKIVFLNNIEIDRLTSDSYVQIPYLYSCENNNFILFIEEADEGGIWGYVVYFIKGRKIFKSGYLNISSVEDVLPFNQKFLECVNSSDKIILKIVPPKYFDTSSYEVKKSSSFKAYLSKKDGKIYYK